MVTNTQGLKNLKHVSFHIAVDTVERLLPFIKSAATNDLANAFKDAAFMFVISDESGRILHANDKLTTYLGKAKTLRELLNTADTDNQAIIAQSVATALKNNKAYHNTLLLNNAQKYKQLFRISLLPAKLDSGNFIIGFFSTSGKVRNTDNKTIQLIRGMRNITDDEYTFAKLLNTQVNLKAEVLLGYINRFLESAQDASDLSTCKNNILHAINFTNMLLSDVRNFNELMVLLRGEFKENNVKSTSVSMVFDSVITAVKKLARRQQVEIITRIASSLPELLVFDFDIVNTILKKLVESALKETSDAIIVLEAACDNSSEEGVTIRFSVSPVKLNDDVIAMIQNADFDNFELDFHGFINNDLGIYLAKRLSILIKEEITVTKQKDYQDDGIYCLSFAIDAKKLVHLEDNRQGVLQGLRILSADDSDIIQKIVSYALESEGAAAVLASNGLEAVDLYRKNSAFDIVLLDIEMPVLNGLEAAEEIVKIQQGTGRKVPIIAITINDSDADKKVFWESGIDDMLVKPFTVDELINKTLECLNGTKSSYNKQGILQVAEISNMIDCISGIDLEKGLRRLLGNEKLYYELLGNFREVYGHAAQTIESLIKAQSYEEAGKRLHELKGVSGNLELTEVCNYTSQLYEAVRSNDLSVASKTIIKLSKAIMEFNDSYDIVAMANDMKVGGLLNFDLLHIKTLLTDLLASIDTDINLVVATDLSDELTDYMKETKYQEIFGEITNKIKALSFDEASILLKKFIREFK